MRLIKHPRPIVALMLFFLVGCAGPITMNKIQYIERGQLLEDFLSMIGRNPSDVLTVVDPEERLDYKILIFPMQTGTATTTHYVNYVTYVSAYPVTSAYAFLFLDDSLLFWGFPHEYARSDEQVIRRLAPLIMEKLENGE